MSAPFIGRPPDRPNGPPAPPPPSGGLKPSLEVNSADLVRLLAELLADRLPSKAEIAEAIRQGTRDAILQADD